MHRALRAIDSPDVGAQEMINKKERSVTKGWNELGGWSNLNETKATCENERGHSEKVRRGNKENVLLKHSPKFYQPFEAFVLRIANH